MFQTKDFVSIVAGALNHMRGVSEKISDFRIGSVARTLTEGPAVELEQFYQQMFIGLREAIPVATFLSFNFEKLPAARATGYVSVSQAEPRTQPLLIPAGAIFSAADGRQYTSVADVTWPAGSNIVRIQVQHTTAGLVGNISAGSITSSTFFNASYTVSNQAIDNGRDEETDAEREGRFAEFVQSISRGTVIACTYAARQSSVLDADGNLAEYVTRSGYVEQGGHVWIYLYSSMGAPSAALLADGQARIDGYTDETTGVVTPGYRAAGVRVDVLAMTERAIDLSIKVGMLPGYTLNSAVEQELGDLFAAQIQAVQPGETLYLGSLVEAMLAAAGVQEIVPLTNENIVCEVNEALIPGTLTVTSL